MRHLDSGKKFRVLEYLARNSKESNGSYVTDEFKHKIMCKSLKVTDANLKKILVRMTAEKLILVDKSMMKKGPSGWVRYLLPKEVWSHFNSIGTNTRTGIETNTETNTRTGIETNTETNSRTGTETNTETSTRT